MKREIEFRAFHKKQKRMFNVYGLGKDFVTENTFNGAEEGVNSFYGENFNDIIIMQFTGLKDTTGRKIFDGDVIDFKSDIQKDFEGGYFEVKWNPLELCWGLFIGGNFIFQMNASMYKEKGGYAIKWINYNYKVIGNIHENPELL